MRDWNEKIADLMNHGLNDEEVTDYFTADEAISFIRDYCAQFRNGRPTCDEAPVRAFLRR